jgi:predicted HNH restriction endonuclease
MTDYQRGANIATILAAVVAGGSVLVGLATFERSTKLERESRAVGLMDSYLTMKHKSPEAQSPTITEGFDWMGARSLFYAESIYNLTGAEGGWRAAISEIIRDHASYVQDSLNSEEYEQNFIAFVDEVLEQE